jgi:hypothetical protein
MGYLAHTLIAFGGKLTTNTPPDEWQCGIRVRLLQPDNISIGNGVTDPAAFLNSLYGPMQTWFQQTASTVTGSERLGLRSDAYLDYLKVNNITAGEVGRGQPGGKYASPTSNTHLYNGTVNGVVTATSCPPFVTAAVSLTTALSRGPGHRGRIYLPLPLALNAQGRMAPLAQAQCNGTVYGLLQTIKAVTDANGTVIPSICSAKNGGRAAITGIATGDVFDVLRRRKDDLAEVYVSRTAP